MAEQGREGAKGGAKGAGVPAQANRAQGLSGGGAGGQASAQGQARELAAAGLQGPAGRLPHQARIQAAFGPHELGEVPTHTGPEAQAALAAMGAQGFAMGGAVALASDDLHTAAHEAAHVVQQTEGVRLKGGEGEDALEAHADAVADRVVAGESATDLLDTAGAARAGSGPLLKVRDQARAHHEQRGDDEVNQDPHGQYADFDVHDGEAPKLEHDHGHLDDGSGQLDPSLREEPTWRDHWARMKWIAKLEAAEALRPDLVDATAAYRHFLFGDGADREIDYQRFIDGDSSGARIYQSVVEDAQHAAITHHDRLIAGKPFAVGTQAFQLRTPAVPVGNDGRYPYPGTENWQKAIGAHSIWVELNVSVEMWESAPIQDRPMGVAEGPAAPPMRGRRFDIEFTIHMEDMYNFNPGAADIATGIPDSDNGRFEITGLGHEYLNRATLTNTTSVEAGLEAATARPALDGDALPAGDRTRQPDGSRHRATAR